MQLTRTQLVDHLKVILAPSPEDLLPPEFSVMESAIRALPGSAEDQFVFLDAEQNAAPEWLTALPWRSVAQWDGSAPHSMGYGDIERSAVGSGELLAALSVSLGGSPLQSATSFYVFPAKLGWVLGL